MGKRRSYHKVRGGCLTCKTRKVRCGLERPICLNCERLCRSCTYSDTKQDESTYDSPSSQPSTGRQLELMHHYTAYTYLTMTDNPILINLWKEVVPKHAFHHHFLLQGLLATAALHQSHHNRDAVASTQLVEVADHLQQEALAKYITLLTFVNEDNCHALFAFSQLLAGFTFARLTTANETQNEDSGDLLSSIIDLFDLLKGTLAVATKAITWLRAGDLAPMLGAQPEVPTLDEIYASGSACAKILSGLITHIGRQENRVCEQSSLHADSLILTIRSIYGLFIEPPASVDMLNKVAGFPVFVDSTYLRLLKARDEAAMVVLAYYGTALHRLNHVWYLHGIGRKIVQAVKEYLAENWLTHLEWPESMTSNTETIIPLRC
ncbi:hypothetical protein S40293_07997 [Stachybotrys chartarum IBT 40293]|nr:hypothetical protein S40293_07997 [Stachybotrys chartarum IBT 40293]